MHITGTTNKRRSEIRRLSGAKYPRNGETGNIGLNLKLISRE
ncbi:hypothetical protein [Paenisporosarcina sp. TG-14]|nr:hypothetical protein [Paenisporosarcina sp. TG-14]